MSAPHVTPRPASVPLRCACGGRIVLDRPRPSVPLVPLCLTCRTPTPAAQERLAGLGLA
jgi:hypothetical protein